MSCEQLGELMDGGPADDIQQAMIDSLDPGSQHLETFLSGFGSAAVATGGDGSGDDTPARATQASDRTGDRW